jgi:hypothetical protein
MLAILIPHHFRIVNGPECSCIVFPILTFWVFTSGGPFFLFSPRVLTESCCVFLESGQVLDYCSNRPSGLYSLPKRDSVCFVTMTVVFGVLCVIYHIYLCNFRIFCHFYYQNEMRTLCEECLEGTSLKVTFRLGPEIGS